MSYVAKDPVSEPDQSISRTLNNNEHDKDSCPPAPGDERDAGKTSDLVYPRSFNYVPRCPILYDAFLSLNCFIFTPMWLMLISLGGFATVLYISYSIMLIRCSLLGYLSYCILNKNAGSGRTFLSQRFIEWCRHYPGHHWAARYFPVQLIKTTDVPAENGPYIFLYHPHGVISMGANTALNTNGCNFDMLFPGIVRWGVTLNIPFTIPFFREWIQAVGFISSNKNNLMYRLKDMQESIVLVPGGSVEALYSSENKFQLVKRRRGFIRLALETGAKPIPVIGFGENRAFSVGPIPQIGTWQHWLQHYLCKRLSFSVPILRSPFPQRTPIYVVVGHPIEFTPSESKADIESKECIEECYVQYKLSVEKLYNDNKKIFGYENVPLEWVD